MKLILLNAATAIVLLIAFYFSVFLLGYGSNSSYLTQEKGLFVIIAIFHIIIAAFFLYRYKQYNLMTMFISMFLVLAIYLVAAWQFQYFG